jgi:UrcA family protein
VKSPTTVIKEIAMNTNIIFRTSRILVFSIAALTAQALLAYPVFAAEPVRTESVKFADLNVNSQAGVEALYGRIHAASERVCSQPGIHGWVNDKVCEAKAQGQAIQKLNLPQLTAYYQKRNGGQQLLTVSR